jgi:glutathione S-transferase
MKVYDFAFSPNCRKVRALAYELGIQVEFVPVDLPKGVQRRAAFLAINPNGRVPVLVEDDLVLWESTAILRYLATKGGGALVPTDPRAQAEVDRWLSWQLAHLGPAMSKVAFERIVKKVTGQGVHLRRRQVADRDEGPAAARLPAQGGRVCRFKDRTFSARPLVLNVDRLRLVGGGEGRGHARSASLTRGVLFLDELAVFRRPSLEAPRQPIR